MSSLLPSPVPEALRHPQGLTRHAPCRRGWPSEQSRPAFRARAARPLSPPSQQDRAALSGRKWMRNARNRALNGTVPGAANLRTRHPHLPDARTPAPPGRRPMPPSSIFATSSVPPCLRQLCLGGGPVALQNSLSSSAGHTHASTARPSSSARRTHTCTARPMSAATTSHHAWGKTDSVTCSSLIQHRPRLAADEPAAHSSVRRAVHRALPTIARRVCGLSVHDAHGGVHGYTDVRVPRRLSLELTPLGVGGVNRGPPAGPPPRGRSLCRPLSSSRPSLVRQGVSLLLRAPRRVDTSKLIPKSEE